jgi:hypothetical protein
VKKMTAPTKQGWIIGQYTGDPHRDAEVSYGTIALSTSLATVVVDGPVYAAVAIGTTGAAALGVRCSAGTANLNAGTVIFAGSAGASDTVHYFIVHAPKR